MIFKLILDFLAFIIDGITSIFSGIPDISLDLSGLNTVVSLLMFMLTKPVVVVAISSLVFWLAFQPTMSLFKFIYRKIPGVS